MHRFTLIGLFILCALLSCTGNQGGANRTTLRVGTDASYPPFESINTNTGQPEGFDIDLITAIADLNGWTTEFIVTPFDGMVPGLTTGKYDVAISAMTITPERAKQVMFSEPYYLAGQAIAVPLENTSISTLDDLKGKRVGVQLGTTGEMMANAIEGAQVISFDNIGAAFIDMANGNLDAVLNDFPTSQAYVRTHGTAKLVGDILSREQYGIAMRLDDTMLHRQINEGLAHIKADTTYRALYLKWFNSLPPDGE